MASYAGGGGISKSNTSSYDNPLAHPIAPTFYNQSAQLQQQQQNQNYPPPPQQPHTQQIQPNPGGIVKSNYSSSENPLSFSGYAQQPNYNNSNYSNDQSYDNYFNSNNNPESYKRVSPEANNKQPDFSGYYSANSNASNSKRESDIRYDVDAMNKQAYKRALDIQVAEKEVLKYNQEKARIRSEIDSIKQYPFGRRTDPASYFDDGRNNYNNVNGYQPSFGNFNNNNNNYEEPIIRLNKDNIVEKPNSLNADVPPYDPIKHRNGYHQGYNYDPWGKPGGGAPLIDPSTGKKFTKYTGQVWYDTIGLSPDERAKLYADKNRPLTLEEQKNEMEIEKQRRRYEEASYKSRTGDLATWISDLENQRLNKIAHGGAHLNHTNVTREKINLEYARKNNINESTKIYHDELGQQLEERHRQNKLYKLKEDVAGIEHAKKWDDWWGRPGGGAPNTDIRRKDIKVDFESPRENKRDNSLDLFGTSLPVGAGKVPYDQDVLFAKGTLRSNHKNMYDNLQPMKL